MSGEPVRRTPSGRPLRLVGSTGVPDSTDGTDGTLALVLSPERQSVAVGRHWVVRAAVDAGVTGMANQVVELLTSELLANAVLHGVGQELAGQQLDHLVGHPGHAGVDRGADHPVPTDRDGLALR